jgi:hypothetical protein
MIRRLTSLILGVPDTGGTSRRLTVVILGGSAVFMALVALAVFWVLGKQEQTARQTATRFAAALVHNDPGTAPGGASDYVTGVRAHFGPVADATVIGAHNKAVGEEPHTRTFFVAELLLRTRRGPAVVELEFDNHDLLGSQEVSTVWELEPADAPDLSADVRNRLEAAYAARGGKPADQLTLTATNARLHRRHARPPVSRRRRRAARPPGSAQRRSGCAASSEPPAR